MNYFRVVCCVLFISLIAQATLVAQSKINPLPTPTPVNFEPGSDPILVKFGGSFPVKSPLCTPSRQSLALMTTKLGVLTIDLRRPRENRRNQLSLQNLSCFNCVSPVQKNGGLNFWFPSQWNFPIRKVTFGLQRNRLYGIQERRYQTFTFGVTLRKPKRE